MPSITMFFIKFTYEVDIRQKLSSALDLEIVKDDDIVNVVCNKNLVTQNPVTP